MLIYIDESGIFANPQEQANAVSCVVALVIPESARTRLNEEFPKLLSNLGISTELKGARLSEQEIDRVLRFIADLGAVAEISAIDLGLHSAADICAYREGQAERFVVNIGPDTKPGMARDLRSMRDRILALPQNLYIQMALMTEHVNRVLRTMTLYFSQRIPGELSRFHWVVDAKMSSVSEYEKLWSHTVLPALQFRSLEEPLAQVVEGDYSHFERFYVNMGRPPRHLARYRRGNHEPFCALDVKKIMLESLSFINSATNPGLQLADVVASAFRRAVRGNLQQFGWRNLGTLLINRSGGSVQMIALKAGAGRQFTSRVPYFGVLSELNRTARSMW